jgi:protein-tyrosine-phosphatase
MYTHPKPQLHPSTARVLRESFGIDIVDHRPQHVDAVARHGFDHVITLCDKARESCPEFGYDPRRAHWSIPNPAPDTDRGGYRRFRQTAAEIDTRVRHLLTVLTASHKEV